MKFAEPTKFRDSLSQEHARLDAMLATVLELTHADVRPRLERQWAVFEESLLSHLEAEETLLLPVVAKHDGAFAARIRDEHTKIRALLGEIGVGLELHMVREERMHQLAQFLRDHAAMEEGPLYLWAGNVIAEGSFRSVPRRLRATWERIRASVTPLKDDSA